MKWIATYMGKRPENHYTCYLIIAIFFLMTTHDTVQPADNHDTVQPADNSDYRLSHVIPFENVDAHDVKTNPTVTEIAIKASPGEFEPGSFMLTAFRGLKNLTITPTDLESGNRIFPKENIDVRVVKIWKQAGRGLRRTKPIEVGELLVKDDASTFSDSYNEQNQYIPPDIPNTFSVRTDLSLEESKQFWITIKIPQDSSPGDYYGGIRIESLNGETPGYLRLKLTVLPIQLSNPRQDRILYYRGSLDPSRGGDFVREDRFIRELQDIRDHGFTGVTVYDEQEKYVRRAVELIADSGIRGAIIFMSPSQKFFEFSISHKIPALFYGADEPNSPERMKSHLEKSARIRTFGGKVVTAITVDWALRLFDPEDLNDPLDVTNLNASPAFFKWISRDSRIKNQQVFRKCWYYWQIMMEKPDLHRLLSGFFLWRSRLDGVFPYVYQHLNSPYSPFDDFAPNPKKYRAIMAAYPSVNGPIPTLQWEAIREGIDDLRYVTTLEALIRSAKTISPLEANQTVRRASLFLDELARKIILTETDWKSDSVMNLIEGVGPREYAGWKKEIIDHILHLQETIKQSKSGL